jgi:hypothetical protein
MNFIYMGRNSDLNIGNGKTVSCVGKILKEWSMNPDRQIYSNIELSNEVNWTELTPENLNDVLEIEDAMILLDELHAIVHKNHRIGEGCKKHGEHIGLCYKLAQFFRQVRKRHIDTYSTVQTFLDAPFQYRTLMQRQIVCEKLHLTEDHLKKCDEDNCPKEHRHFIRQNLFQNYHFVKEIGLFDPEPYYDLYNSYEVVKGWVTYE